MPETVTVPAPPAAHWCVLELMGHVRLAGRVSEEEKFGAKLGRIDVVGADGRFSYTRYFNAASVYSLSYVTEAAAVAAARHCSSDPVKPWELPQVQPVRAALPAADPLDFDIPFDTTYPAKPAAGGEPDGDEEEDDSSDLEF